MPASRNQRPTATRAGKRKPPKTKSRKATADKPKRGEASRRAKKGHPAGRIIGPERIQKVLATAGFGSRRECEQLLLAGRVEIDGHVVTELGTRVDAQRQEIRVDGARVTLPKKVYYMVNKPPGVVSTMRDPQGRPRVVDLLPSGGQRVYNVGRLDKSSEGLILLTNDGQLANQLTHPRYGVEKTYRVLIAGVPTRGELTSLRRGVHLAEGLVRVAHIKLVSQRKQSSMVEIVLSEGRNREIRRILAHLGHKVMQLRRVAIGGLRLGNLPPGHWRPLRSDEVRKLRHAIDHPRPKPSAKPRQSGRAKSAN